MALLEGFDGLDRYLVSAGVEPRRRGRAGRGDRGRAAAISALLARCVRRADATSSCTPSACEAALERLERSALAQRERGDARGDAARADDHLGRARRDHGPDDRPPRALQGLPDGARARAVEARRRSPVVVLASRASARTATRARRIAQGREVLGTCCARCGCSATGASRSARSRGRASAAARWARSRSAAADAARDARGDRRAGGRAAGVLQSGLAPRAPPATSWPGRCGASSWAASARTRYEALTDHLLALRALLEPEGPSSGLLAGRLAALCATPERRGELTERVVAARRARARRDRRRLGEARRRPGARAGDRRSPARAAARRDLRPPRPRPARASPTNCCAAPASRPRVAPALRAEPPQPAPREPAARARAERAERCQANRCSATRARPGEILDRLRRSGGTRIGLRLLELAARREMVSRSRRASTSKSARLCATRARQAVAELGSSSVLTSSAEWPPQAVRWTRLTISSPRACPPRRLSARNTASRCRLGLGRGDDQEVVAASRSSVVDAARALAEALDHAETASGRSVDSSASMSTPVTRAKIENTSAVPRPNRRAVSPPGRDEHLQRPSFEEPEQASGRVEEVQRVARGRRVEHDHVEVALLGASS